MIKVQNLIKHYGHAIALRGVSFEVPSGQVLGFLGPNGAGKSTTMKIITGYLTATSGKVIVDGLDASEHALEVRRKVGYLPENNPLYRDMRVDDYLRFAGKIRGMRGARLGDGIDRVVASCGISKVFKKGISELSKGFRQRVGLAQAMLHDPEILILDEPTSGLDPNQIVEIRQLIRSIADREDRTVILSTHYLQEVEATSDRIMIISRGEIVADGSMEQLVAEFPAGSIDIEVEAEGGEAESALQELFPNSQVHRTDASGGIVRFEVELDNHYSGDPRPQVSTLAVQRGWKLLELHRRQATLETVFRAKTISDDVDRSPATAV
ncbi:MAG: ABC transporter [Planctomycetota bacterium]|nr:MAG: ABC transporter [Planctomycetota bacterium]